MPLDMFGKAPLLEMDTEVLGPWQDGADGPWCFGLLFMSLQNACVGALPSGGAHLEVGASKNMIGLRS